jgi:hypothetical protein
LNLIKISETVLVNPEKISAIEHKSFLDESTGTFNEYLVVIVEGSEFIVTIKTSELLKSLIESGITQNTQMWQYWAG